MKMSGAITTLSWRDGTIVIEGLVLRVGAETGARALEGLVRLLDEHGPAGVARAEGDFVALIETPRQLHAFKSFTSQFQLYYRQSDGLVSNRLFPFWRQGADSWNEDYFARHVLIVPGYQFISRETPILQVNRVLPGELVSIGRDTKRTQLVRRDYQYRFEGGVTRQEAAERVLQILRDSIKTRLAARPQSRICVEISGGLDSSFIACLLGEAASNIRGVMFSQPGVPSHVASEGYARDVAQKYGIDLVIVPPEDLPSPPSGTAPYCDEPSDFFWFGDIFSRGVAQWAEPESYVFTGFGADQLFLRSPAILPHLLTKRELRAFRNTLPAASRLLSRSRLSLAWQCAASQLPAGMHRRLHRVFDSLGWNPWDVSDVNMARALTNEVNWLHCGKGLDAYSRERQEAERPLVGNGIICDDWGYLSAPRVVTQAHFAQKRLVDASPFCDLALLDFTYDHINALMIHDFGARYKELLRDAQKGVVPETLRNRQNDTFVFNSFQMKYVDQQRERFEDYLNGVNESWIDKRAARGALQQLSFGMTTSSTRSVLALMGYLQWKESFLSHCAASKRAADASYFEASASRT